MKWFYNSRIAITILFTSFFLMCKAARSTVVDKHGFTIHVRLMDSVLGDTVFLLLGNEMLWSPIWNDANEKIGVVDAGGEVSFHVFTTEAAGIFTLFLKKCENAKGITNRRKVVVRPQLWEAGDNIGLTIVKNTISFTGRGAEKYNARFELLYNPDQKVRLSDFQDENLLIKWAKLAGCKMRMLQGWDGQMSKLSYEVLKADVLYHFKYLLIKQPQKIFEDAKGYATDKSVRSYLAAFGDEKVYGLSDTALALSTQFLYFRYAIYRNKTAKLSEGYDMDSLFYYILNEPIQKVRDRLLVSFFLKEKLPQQAADEWFATALATMKNEQLRSIVNNAYVFKNEMTGKLLPADTLLDKDRLPVSLASLKGKVLVVDFWNTGCGACAKLYADVLKAVKDRMIAREDILFVSIAVDKKFNIWNQSVASGKYTAANALNLYTGEQGAKHPFVKSLKVTSYPTLIVVDRNNKVLQYNTDNLYTVEGLTKLLTEI
jgi:thiol-disulfide isomerase/thioredoxin